MSDADPQRKDPPRAEPDARSATERSDADDDRRADEEWSTKKKWALGLGILAVGVAGFVLLQVLKSPPPTQEPPPTSPLVTTVPADVVRDARITVEGYGTVRARTTVQLAPQVAGRVVYVAPSLVSGGTIREGQTLVRVDPEDYRNAVEQARAEVARQEVEVLRAQQQRQIAQEEIRRFEQREGIDVPAPESEAGALAANLPQFRAAEAALQSARARLADAQLQLDRTSVTAPFTGRVQSKQVGEGAYAAPGQVLATIYPSDVLEVPVALSPAEAALVPDLFAVDAGGGATGIGATVFATFGGERFAWRGYVDRAESALDPQSRTVTAVVRVDRPYALDLRLLDGEEAPPPPRRPPLLLGQYVTVEIEGRRFERYVAVPREALRVRGADPAVWTVEDDTTLVEVPVRVIQEVGGQALLEADVAARTPVITSDIEGQTDGMTVRVAADSATVAAPADVASGGRGGER